MYNSTHKYTGTFASRAHNHRASYTLCIGFVHTPNEPYCRAQHFSSSSSSYFCILLQRMPHDLLRFMFAAIFFAFNGFFVGVHWNRIRSVSVHVRCTHVSAHACMLAAHVLPRHNDKNQFVPIIISHLVGRWTSRQVIPNCYINESYSIENQKWVKSEEKSNKTICIVHK